MEYMGDGEENHLGQGGITTEGNSYAVAIPPAVEPAPPIAGSHASVETIGAPGLPQAAAGADLPLSHKPLNRLWPISCFLVTFLLYVSLIPHFILYSSPPSGDQPFYLMDVASIVQDFDLNVKNNYDSKDYDKLYSLAPHPPGFVGMNAPYPLGRQLADTPNRPKSEQYSYHLPGLPILLAPAWLIGSWFRWWWPATLVVMCLLGALLGANVFLFAHELTGKLWIAIVVWLAIAFSNPIMTYSYLVFTEMPTGLLLLYAFRRLALGWEANGPWRRLLVGVCIGYMPWLAWRAVLISPVLLLYAAIQWWRYYRPSAPAPIVIDESEGTHKSLFGSIIRPIISGRGVLNSATFKSASWLLAPVIISAVLLASYHMFLFGRPMPSTTIAEPGRIIHFNWPWGGIDSLRQFLTALYGTFFDMGFGLLPYAPVYLLAFVGIIAMFRSGRVLDRRLLLWLGLLLVPYMFLILAFEGWDGIWCPPARYMATFVPLAAAPFAVSLSVIRSVLYKAIFGAIFGLLAIPGFVLAGIMMYDARAFWPYPFDRVFYGLASGPELPIHVDVRGFLTQFRAPDPVLFPINLAWNIAVSLLIVLLCYALLMLARRGEGFRVWSPAKQGAAWATSVAVIWLGWYVVNYEHLQPKTILVEQHRWNLSSPTKDPFGICYLDGKVYVTSYGSEGSDAVGVLDVRTGSYKLIRPVSATGVITVSRPGDIKVGPDGLLYLLNNGPKQPRLLHPLLYVMKPSGEVVREIELKSKTPYATGLLWGPDGMIYVSDLQAGSILKYSKSGGDPLQVWGGMPGGYIFNNPTGLVIDSAGALYVLVGGEGIMQKLNPNKAETIARYDVKCHPIHAVASGDWLDISCSDAGMVSFNIKDHSIQRSVFKPQGSLKPIASRGLAYGPGNILYLLDADQNAVIEYKVQH